MGYTHYFSFKVPKGVKAAVLEATYQAAIRECSKVAKVYNKECNAKGLTDARLSGYTAHAKIGEYGHLFRFKCLRRKSAKIFNTRFKTFNQSTIR